MTRGETADRVIKICGSSREFAEEMIEEALIELIMREEERAVFPAEASEMRRLQRSGVRCEATQAEARSIAAEGDAALGQRNWTLAADRFEAALTLELTSLT